MYVRIHVVPSAKKEKVVQESETVFTISVKEPAEQNLANKRIRELLALHFHLPENQIRITSGHRSPHKIIDVAI